MLTRSRGDFDEILAGSRPDRRADRRHRAGARVRAAGDAGRQARRLAPTSSCSPSTARSCGRARASTTCSCASRARWPASCRSSACCRSRSPPRTSSASTGSSTARPTTSSPRWRARGLSYADALGQAQELGYAEADPTDDVTGRDAAAKMAILARLAFSTPVHLDQVIYEGIEHITAEDMAYAQRARPRAEADRHRRARRRRHQRARAPGVPVRAGIRWPRQRPVQRGHRRVRRDHRDHAVGPGRRRPADRERGARRRDLRDDPARLDAGDDRVAAGRQRRRVGVLPAHGGRRPARRARPGRRAARDAGRVDQVGRAEGPGRATRGS